MFSALPEAAKEEMSLCGPLCADPAAAWETSCVAENSRHGFQLLDSTLRLASGEVKSTTALGIAGTLYDGGIRSRCTGKERDSESGFDYFGARYYSNGLGRFITPDWAAKAVDVPYAEFSDPQSLNLYSYVRNVPTGKVDADGHVALVDDAAVATLVVGTIAVLAVAAYTSQPENQRNFNNAVNSAIGTVKGWFHKSDNASKSSPAPQSNPAPGTQTSTQMPKNVYIDPAKHPASAGHAADAIKSGQPDVLTVNRPGSDANRAAATAGHPTQPTTDRDEYPPAVTEEGGAGASVRNIPSSDNRGSGGSLGQQIKDVPDGGQIKVNIGPKPKE